MAVGFGTIPISVPHVNDRRTDQDGERRRFTSRIPPPCMRRSPKVAEVLPVLYLRVVVNRGSPAPSRTESEDAGASGMSVTSRFRRIGVIDGVPAGRIFCIASHSHDAAVDALPGVQGADSGNG